MLYMVSPVVDSRRLLTACVSSSLEPLNLRVGEIPHHLAYPRRHQFLQDPQGLLQDPLRYQFMPFEIENMKKEDL